MRHVHFIAIAGTGMGSLAGLLKSRGLGVTGSDADVYPPMSTALEAWGIPVAKGFRPENVLERRPDLVVIGNAVRADNPEARAAIDAGLPFLSFPDALYEHAIKGKHSVVVAGTHGKTTTGSIMTNTTRRSSTRLPSSFITRLGLW
jgi:UDP-N-acetylmuramate: L-alanyl-gamma-D-glutamyl-meso-diaminopimelate ligase